MDPCHGAAGELATGRQLPGAPGDAEPGGAGGGGEVVAMVGMEARAG